jgi:hypothetical protein
MEDKKSKYVQWFCGFYEGEGWITNDITNNNHFRIGLAQNDPFPLELCKEIWGGYLRKRERTTNATSKLCIGYELILSYQQSKKFIEDIKPYMVIPYKIKQIEEAEKKAEKGLDRRFKCKYCDLDYASPSGRRRHELQIHINSDASQGSNDLRQDNQIAGNP